MRDSFTDTAVITTFAGTGAPGHTGDGGPAIRAQFNQPFTVVFDAAGNITTAESGGNVVRRIEARSTRVSTLAGVGGKGAYGGDGGPAIQAAFNDSVCCAVEPSTGNLYIVDRLNGRIRKVDIKSGIITTVVGTGIKGFSGDGGPGEMAQIREPHDAVFDGKGGLLICDIGDCRIRRLDIATGVITTFGGTGKHVHTGDGGPVATASFAGSRALAIDRANNILYICEREGNNIRRVDLRTGIITPFAGTGKKGLTGDGGLALQATFNGPKGLACHPSNGTLFVCDTENHAIRSIDPKTGIITTVAGGHRGPDGDNGPAVKAGLNRPHGATVGPDNRLYIADSENNRIRTVPLA